MPPKEGRASWKGDFFIPFLKDAFFQYLRKFLFQYRLKRSKIDYCIVPSLDVLHELSKILPKNIKSEIIPHGIIHSSEEEYLSSNYEQKDVVISFLTVGGFAPSKNQLIIPEIALKLKLNGIQFKWDIVGPIRNERYVKAIKEKVFEYNLQDNIYLSFSITDSELNKMYKKSNIYIHTSFEEGFCFTVLDAAVFKLPIIGINVGEIAPIINQTNGVVVDNSVDSFYKAILYLKDNLKKEYNCNDFVNFYSWESTIRKLFEVYKKLTMN